MFFLHVDILLLGGHFRQLVLLLLTEEGVNADCWWGDWGDDIAEELAADGDETRTLPLLLLLGGLLDCGRLNETAVSSVLTSSAGNELCCCCWPAVTGDATGSRNEMTGSFLLTDQLPEGRPKCWPGKGSTSPRRRAECRARQWRGPLASWPTQTTICRRNTWKWAWWAPSERWNDHWFRDRAQSSPEVVRWRALPFRWLSWTTPRTSPSLCCGTGGTPDLARLLLQGAGDLRERRVSRPGRYRLPGSFPRLSWQIRPDCRQFCRRRRLLLALVVVGEALLRLSNSLSSWPESEATAALTSRPSFRAWTRVVCPVSMELGGGGCVVVGGGEGRLNDVGFLFSRDSLLLGTTGRNG